MTSLKLMPLPMPRERRRLVFAPPNHLHSLAERDGDATLVCGSAGCAFEFGRGLDPFHMQAFAFRCPACGTESEVPVPV